MCNKKDYTRFGLIKRDFDHIEKTIKKFPEIERAIIFGSRAMGNYKQGSDVDIAIEGKCISDKTVTQLSAMLNEEMPLPYYFDIIHYGNLKNNELKRHIDEEGKKIIDI